MTDDYLRKAAARTDDLIERGDYRTLLTEQMEGLIDLATSALADEGLLNSADFQAAHTEVAEQARTIWQAERPDEDVGALLAELRQSPEYSNLVGLALAQIALEKTPDMSPEDAEYSPGTLAEGAAFTLSCVLTLSSALKDFEAEDPDVDVFEIAWMAGALGACSEVLRAGQHGFYEAAEVLNQRRVGSLAGAASTNRRAKARVASRRETVEQVAADLISTETPPEGYPSWSQEALAIEIRDKWPVQGGAPKIGTLRTDLAALIAAGRLHPT